MNPELVSYIERHLNKGISTKKIKDTLLKAGHSKELVDEVFNHLLITKPNIFKKKYFWLIFFSLLAVAAIIFFIFKVPISTEAFKQISSSDIDFSSMSDTDLLLYAQKLNSTKSCEFIIDNYNKGLCINRLWDSRPCYFKRVTGDDSPC